MCGLLWDAAGVLGGVPLGEGVEEDRAAGWSEGKTFPFLNKKSVLYYMNITSRTWRKKCKSYIKNANSCSMCKRMVINAGIKTVIIRLNRDEYKTIEVSDWVENDESVEGAMGY